MASAYHVKFVGATALLQVIGVVPRRLKTVECETELTDGTFVTTSNTAESVKTKGYPFMDQLRLPAKTPTEQIVREHRARLKAVIAARKEGRVAPLRYQNITDYQASQDRAQLLKTAYRKSPDFDFHAELASIAGRPLRDSEHEMADQVSHHLQSPSLPEGNVSEDQ